MNAMATKSAQVLAVLKDGSATTGEVAAELGWTVHLTCAHLKNLHLRGKIQREQFPMPDRRIRFLWRLPDEAANA